VVKYVHEIVKRVSYGLALDEVCEVSMRRFASFSSAFFGSTPTCVFRFLNLAFVLSSVPYGLYS
jgi:hypothetical protein